VEIFPTKEEKTAKKRDGCVGFYHANALPSFPSLIFSDRTPFFSFQAG
jgi:hypothetical protein